MRKLTWILLVAVAAGLALGHIIDTSHSCELLPLASGSPENSPPPGSGFTAVTLNLAEETKVDRIIADLEKAPVVRNADLFLLQEVMHSGVPEGLGRVLSFHWAYAPVDKKSLAAPRGLAILSRYPLRDLSMAQLKVFNLHLRSRCRVSLGVTVDAPFGPMRVYDVHLDNRISAKERVAQLEPVADAAKEFAGPIVVGGDLNTSKILWVEHLLPLPYLQMHANPVTRMMAAKGFMTPFTSDTPTFDVLPFRLDWLYLKRLEAGMSGTEKMKFSDHHAVWLRLSPARTASSAN